MVRQSNASKTATTTTSGSRKLVTITCVSLLGFGLIADYLWASSSSQYFASSNTIFLPQNHQGEAKKGSKKEKVSGRVLSATFFDLPAPELEWEKLEPVPVPRLDGAAIQIKNLFYVFAGYGTIDYIIEMILALVYVTVLVAILKGLLN